MFTASRLAELLTEATDQPDGNLYPRIARTLINAGHLPRSQGRSCPFVTVDDAARMLLAIGGTFRVSHSAPAMQERFNLPLYMPTGGYEAGTRCGDFLANELDLLAGLDDQTWHRWQYSDLIVAMNRPTVEIVERDKGRTALFIDSQAFEGRQGLPIRSTIGGDILCKIGAEIAGKPYLEAVLVLQGKATANHA